eukprot:2660350-Pyramimonas_sp.AAC.2
MRFTRPFRLPGSWSEGRPESWGAGFCRPSSGKFRGSVGHGADGAISNLGRPPTAVRVLRLRRQASTPATRDRPRSLRALATTSRYIGATSKIATATSSRRGRSSTRPRRCATSSTRLEFSRTISSGRRSTSIS